MALALKTSVRTGFTGRLDRHDDVSEANTALTVSLPTGNMRQLILVTAKFSSGTTGDVSTTLNSGAGTSRDTLLSDIDLDGATDAAFIPDGDVLIGEDDSIDVLADAGGVGITCAVAIYTKVL